MKNTIEKIVSEAILEDSIRIEVNGALYQVANPSVATLIEISKYISQLPEIKIDENEDITKEVLSLACDYEFLGDIAAILILGKKNLSTHKKVKVKRLFGLLSFKKTIEFDNQKELAKEILLNLNAADLQSIISKILGTLRLDFFFSISTFLKEVNLTRATRKMTVSGQL